MSKTKTIAVVDDDPVCREILGEILAMRSYNVKTFASGQLLLNALPTLFSTEEAPIAMFLDVLLGDMTGVQLLEFLRSNENTKTLPVIMLSANSQLEVETIYGGPTPNHFIEKPFVAETVYSALDLVLANDT